MCRLIKLFLLTLTFTLCLSGVPNSMIKMKITLEKPTGFKACIPDNGDISMLTFSANLNENVFIPQKTSILNNGHQTDDGFWCYVDHDTVINQGDVMNYMYEYKVNSGSSHYRSYIYTKVFGDEDDTEKGTKEACQYNSNEDINVQSRMNQNTKNNVLPTYPDPQESCRQSIDNSKKAIFHLIDYNSRIEKELVAKKEDLNEVKTQIKNYKALLTESFRIISQSLPNKTNKLKIVTQFPMGDNYLLHVIPNELRIDINKYDFVNIQRNSLYETTFEMMSYALKLKIYLTSRVKLTGTKIKMYDIDFESNIDTNH